MIIKLIFAEGRNKEHTERRLKQGMYDREIKFEKEQYNGESLATKVNPTSYKYTNDGSQWYIGRGCEQYVGVVIQIDDQEPSEPIMSDIQYNNVNRCTDPNVIENFDNKISEYISEKIGTIDYIELDDIVL